MKLSKTGTEHDLSLGSQENAMLYQHHRSAWERMDHKVMSECRKIIMTILNVPLLPICLLLTTVNRFS